MMMNFLYDDLLLYMATGGFVFMIVATVIVAYISGLFAPMHFLYLFSLMIYLPLGYTLKIIHYLYITYGNEDYVDLCSYPLFSNFHFR